VSCELALTLRPSLPEESLNQNDEMIKNEITHPFPSLPCPAWAVVMVAGAALVGGYRMKKTRASRRRLVKEMADEFKQTTKLGGKADQRKNTPTTKAKLKAPSHSLLLLSLSLVSSCLGALRCWSGFYKIQLIFLLFSCFFLSLLTCKLHTRP